MRENYEELFGIDFSTFVGAVLNTSNPGAHYEANWHIDLIAERLEAPRKGEIKRLIINMPPRALKSVCVSVAWPAWILGHDPKARIMAASYAMPLSLKHSLDCRMVLQAEWYQELFPGTRITSGQNERHKFATTQRGFRYATSVGGSATGEGGNFLILDDPLSPQRAMAKLWRDKTNAWFENTFASRLDDKKNGVIVLVMQRLHVEDLSGYLLERGGWEHLCLPAVADKVFHYTVGGVSQMRAAGEVLHAKRESVQLLERAKHELGSVAFSAQYQQAPVIPEGGMVRPWWFKRHGVLPVEMRVVQSWDTAIKSGIAHDASVCLTFGEAEGVSYLLDAAVMRLEYPELKRAVVSMAAQWKAEVVLMEDKASGQQLIQDLRKESYLSLVATMPRGDKVTRFAAVSALIEAGKISLPKHAAWLADFEAELLGFPAGLHDDQVDALSQYLDWKRRSELQTMQIRRI